MHLNKAKLAQAIADQYEIPREQAYASLDMVFDVIIRQLAAGNSMSVTNGFRIDVMERTPRQGRNPATGEKVQIPAKRRARFHFHEKVHDFVNGDTEVPPPGMSVLSKAPSSPKHRETWAAKWAAVHSQASGAESA